MRAPATVLVTGATGFVGSRLLPLLVDRGLTVRAMTRKPDDYDGPGEAVGGDVHDPSTLTDALADVDVAVYLVHSLEDADFERKDADAARAFGRAAAKAGVRQIVYLGGLGEDDEALSAHLRSRREVERLLGESGVPVTALRAAIVIGDDGISWEITRQLVENLPGMVVPKWVHTETQPIAIDDVVGYLDGVIDHDDAIGETFDIGGPDRLSYLEMLQVVAEQMRGHRVPIRQVPLLTPRLSSYWLALVTDVDIPTARHLVDSMTNEMLAHDDSIRAVVPLEPMSYAEAVRRALAQRDHRR